MTFSVTSSHMTCGYLHDQVLTGSMDKSMITR